MFFILLVVIQQSFSTTIYLLPHSHDDPGWLDTADLVYESIVRKILTSWSNSLLINKERKFVQVETYYFKRWWEEQTIEIKQKIKTLIQEQQLDFAGGGWCMNDEATPYYENIIDQFTGGHRYLFKEIGVIPKVGWQVDIFGHSSTHAYISFMLGMDGQYFARVDHIDRQKRLQGQAMEFIWNPKPGVEIFCHVNYKHYSSPPDCDFDPLSKINPKLTTENLQQRASQLYTYFQIQKQFYKGETIVHTLGEDRRWSEAEIFFQNMEKLTTTLNQKENLDKIYYSTPHQYLKILNKQNLSYTVKYDDFYPYSDDYSSYWGGFFTSRVSFKGFVRYLGKEYLQIKTFLAKQISNGKINNIDEIINLIDQHGMIYGIAQHHDAITGTSRQHVINDYITKITNSQQNIHQFISYFLQKKTKENLQQDYEFYTYQYNSTTSECKELKTWLENNKPVLLTLIENSDPLIKIAVPIKNYQVLNQYNQLQKSELICEEEDCILYILLNEEIIQDITYLKIITLGDLQQNFHIPLVNITSKSKISIDEAPYFSIYYEYYISSTDSKYPSGPYIFRPEGEKQNYGEIEESYIYNGTLLTEIILKREKVITKIRKYKHRINEYEIETFVDSIEYYKGKGKEIVMIIETDIKNEKIFWTDSNGLDLQQRILNYRETFPFINNQEPEPQNYYPITNMIVLRQQNGDSVALINDRTQGGTSMIEGTFEILIQRRTLIDDHKGLGQGVREDVFDGQQCLKKRNCILRKGLQQTLIHQLLFFNNISNPNAARQVQLREDMIGLKYFAQDFSQKFDQINYKIESSLFDDIIIENLQEDQNIISVSKIRLQPIEQGFLIRIHNMAEIGQIKYVFPKEWSVYETTFSGLQTIKDWQETKLKWQNQDPLREHQEFFKNNIILPQYIRTFIIQN